MGKSEMDRIEKRIELRAPVSRVWRALTDHREFGQWFQVELESPFAVGKVTRGRITTPGYDYIVMELQVEAIEPERRFAYRWNAEGPPPKGDQETVLVAMKEPTTLVEFVLEKTAAGTLLTITESGFEAVPPEKRAEIFRGNDQGWAQQAKNIEAHVSQAA